MPDRAPLPGRACWYGLPCSCCNTGNKRKTKRSEKRQARREIDDALLELANGGEDRG